MDWNGETALQWDMGLEGLDGEDALRMPIMWESRVRILN
jgi:hypothetical protein